MGRLRRPVVDLEAAYPGDNHLGKKNAGRTLGHGLVQGTAGGTLLLPAGHVSC